MWRGPRFSGWMCQRVASQEKPWTWHLLNWRIAAKEFAISGAEHNQRIRDKQTLTIAYDPNQAPFSLLGDDGQPTGYTVDLCRIVASQLVTQLNMGLMDVRWIKTNSRSRFDVIESGDADLECSATSNTLDRQKQFAFSLTTFIQGATIAVRQDTDLQKLEELASKKIAVVRNTTTSKLMKRAISESFLLKLNLSNKASKILLNFPSM